MGFGFDLQFFFSFLSVNNVTVVLLSFVRINLDCKKKVNFFLLKQLGRY